MKFNQNYINHIALNIFVENSDNYLNIFKQDI